MDFKFINEKRESEQSATIVWDILQNFGQKPLIWNIFPFHPHHNGNQKNNRTPNKKELELGKEYLVKLLELFKIEVIIAAGKKPKSKLDDIGICSQYIRHPANGGKKDFNESIQKILG